MSARKQMEKLMGKMKKGGTIADLMPQGMPGDGTAPPPRARRTARRRKSRR